MRVQLQTAKVCAPVCEVPGAILPARPRLVLSNMSLPSCLPVFLFLPVDEVLQFESVVWLCAVLLKEPQRPEWKHQTAELRFMYLVSIERRRCAARLAPPMRQPPGCTCHSQCPDTYLPVFCVCAE